MDGPGHPRHAGEVLATSGRGINGVILRRAVVASTRIGSPVLFMRTIQPVRLWASDGSEAE